jgi:hypothetical protein
MKRIPGEWRYFDEALNMPFPWYTSTSLEFLETLDLKGKRVFEYGVGESTEWYRAKGAEVFGVDIDPHWAAKVGAKFTIWNNEYVHAIDQLGLFDIVAIDGAWRDECVERAVLHLKPGGLLIIDNFEQPSVEPNRWDKAYELLSRKKSRVYFEPEHEDWKTLIVTI